MRLLPLLFLLPALAHPASTPDAEAINLGMSPGINYGNVLEADPPESWGGKADAGDFALMAKAGFKGLRLPVRWSAMAAKTPPYTIDPAFDLKVQKLVYAAMKNGLTVVLNMHHYDEIFKQPAAHLDRFLAIWAQIAQRYKAYPRTLVFEILNEPHDALTAKLWNLYYGEALRAIRKVDPERVVMLGGADWGGTKALGELSLPRRDKNIIFTFHHYSPFEFTHQGADWVGPQTKAWLGKTWSGSGSEISTIKKEFEIARNFARKYSVPVCMGEYGAFSKADMASRVAWTREMSKLAIKFGYSRFYWEFKSGFGLYDPTTKKWNEELTKAVVNP